MKEAIQKLDFFPKITDSSQLKHTKAGGLIFLVALVLMIYLTVSEFCLLLVGEMKIQPILVANDNDERIRVNLNISLYEVPCEAVALDMQDITGFSLEDFQHTLYKLELDKHGYATDAAKAEEFKSYERKVMHPSSPTWSLGGLLGSHDEDSCYGAELYEGQKCKTCEDVLNVYRSRGWPVPPREAIAQCMPSGVATKRLVQRPQAEHSVQVINIGGRLVNVVRIGRRLLSDTSDEAEVQHTTGSLDIKTILRREKSGAYFDTTIFDLPDILSAGEGFSVPIRRQNCSHAQKFFLKLHYKNTNGDIEQITTGQLLVPGLTCNDNIHFIWEEESNSEDSREIVLSWFHEQFSKKITVSLPQGDNELLTMDLLNEELVVLDTATISLTSRRMLQFHSEDYGGRYEHGPRPITFQEFEAVKKQLGTGCQLYGHFFVRKVPGNFHISTHSKAPILMRLNHEVSARHKIHMLEFTKEKEEITQGAYAKHTNTLDGAEALVGSGTDVEYYLKIMDSYYQHSIWGEKQLLEFVSHKSTVEKNNYVAQVQFKYDFEPVSMQYVSRGGGSIWQFLVSLCAIIGGVFAASTFFETIVSRYTS